LDSVLYGQLGLTQQPHLHCIRPAEVGRADRRHGDRRGGTGGASWPRGRRCEGKQLAEAVVAAEEARELCRAANDLPSVASRMQGTRSTPSSRVPPRTRIARGTASRPTCRWDMCMATCRFRLDQTWVIRHNVHSPSV